MAGGAAASASVSRAPASVDPGVTRAHSCSDSLCKHPLPAGLPPPPARPAGPGAPRPGPQGLPSGATDHRVDRAGPPALEWKPLLDSLRPAPGDPLCQEFSGKTRVYSVCSQGQERPGRGGHPCSSQVTSACFPLRSRPPPGWPLLGAPPETPTLQPCFPSAPTRASAVVLPAVCCPPSSGPTLHPRLEHRGPWSLSEE